MAKIADRATDYEQFLTGVQPVYLAVTKSASELDRKKFFDLGEDVEVERVLESEYRVADSGQDYFDVRAVFGFSYRQRGEAVSGSAAVSPFLRITCVFEGHFHSRATVAYDHAERFAARNAWLIFWPYFRQFVTDIMSRMAIPPAVLPLGLAAGTFTRPAPQKARVKRQKPPARRKS